MEFLVQDSAGSGHPLHIALADDAAVAGGVAVLHFAGIHDGDRFKAAMRVLAHATAFRGGLKVGGGGIIQQQKRAALRHIGAVVIEHPVHRKPIAHPVPAGGGGNAKNRLHVLSPTVSAGCRGLVGSMN